MSKVFAISYSNFGYLLTDLIYQIEIKKLEDYDYGLYEDILTADEIVIKRRFLANLSSVFDIENTQEVQAEAELPSDVTRFIMTYKGTDVVVIGSHDFELLFKDKATDDKGFIETDSTVVEGKSQDLENLAEDVVLLASNGIDLNAVELQQISHFMAKNGFSTYNTISYTK